MYRPGIGSHDHQSGSGGQKPDREDHLSCSVALSESLWDTRKSAAFSGGAEGQGGQCQTAAGCPGTETYRFFLPGAGASAGSLSGGGLYNGSSQDGQIYGDQRENLSDLSEIYCSGGYPCLFH